MIAKCRNILHSLYEATDIPVLFSYENQGIRTDIVKSKSSITRTMDKYLCFINIGYILPGHIFYHFQIHFYYLDIYFIIRNRGRSHSSNITSNQKRDVRFWREAVHKSGRQAHGRVLCWELSWTSFLPAQFGSASWEHLLASCIYPARERAQSLLIKVL